MSAPLLLAVALVASTATQLRVGETPLGPGEVLLVGWICYAGLAFALRSAGPRALAPQFRAVTLFWLLSWLLLVIGGFAGYRNGLLSTAKAFHDALAFAFATVFCITLAMQAGMARPVDVCRVLVTTVSLACLSILLLAFASPRLGPITWWFGPRLTGWSENPNQLAQLVIPTPFLLMFLIPRARTAPGQLSLIAAFVLVLIFGLMIRSDAIVLAWLVGAAASALVFLGQSIRRSRNAASAMLVRLLVPGLVIAGVAAFLAAFLGDIRGVFNEIIAERGQGAVRFVLWMHGIQAILESPFYGFGPGAHSGLLAPFQGKETHNSILDWGTSTGMLGVGVLTCFLLVLFRTVWRAGNAALIGAFLAMMAFMQFHYAMRHPIFWFHLILIVGLGLAADRRQHQAWRRHAASVAAPPPSVLANGSSRGIA